MSVRNGRDRRDKEKINFLNFYGAYRAHYALTIFQCAPGSIRIGAPIFSSLSRPTMTWFVLSQNGARYIKNRFQNTQADVALLQNDAEHNYEGRLMTDWFNLLHLQE